MKNDVSAIPAGKSNYLKRLLFLLVCVLMSGNAVWAQQPTITIHAKNQSLKEVLKEIEQQSKRVPSMSTRKLIWNVMVYL